MENLTPTRSVIMNDTNGSPSLSVKMLDKSYHLPHHLNMFNQMYRESYLTMEYSLLSMSNLKLGGVYVIPSAKSSYLWFGVIFVHSGPYSGGIFRFTIKFQESFPDNHSIPTVTLQPPVFHPLIHLTKGVLEIKRNFQHGWNRNNNHVWQVLKCVRKAFYSMKIETDHPLNKKAAELYDNNPEEFKRIVQKEVEESLSRAYDKPPDEYADDGHFIIFSPYSPAIHDNIRSQLLKPLLTITTNTSTPLRGSNSFTSITSLNSLNNTIEEEKATSSSTLELDKRRNNIALSQDFLSPNKCITKGFSWIKNRLAKGNNNNNNNNNNSNNE